MPPTNIPPGLGPVVQALLDRQRNHPLPPVRPAGLLARDVVKLFQARKRQQQEQGQAAERRQALGQFLRGPVPPRAETSRGAMMSFLTGGGQGRQPAVRQATAAAALPSAGLPTATGAPLGAAAGPLDVGGFGPPSRGVPPAAASGARSPAVPRLRSDGAGDTPVFGTAETQQALADEAPGNAGPREAPGHRTVFNPAADADGTIGAPPTAVEERTPPIPRRKPLPPTIDNPTDGDERNDDAGSGWFRASRVNKPVTGHLGVDITAEPGTPVRSPIDGVIYKRGKAYKEKKYDRFDTVWINGTGDYQGLQVRMFYVDRVGPVNGNDKDGIGARVVGGTTIVGGLQDITQKGSNSDKGMKPHVHMQVYWHGKLIDPARVLPAWESQRPD